MNIKIKSVIITSMLLICYATVFNACAQAPASLVDNLHPVSPTAWQFLKYDDLPVSEYTGIPNISIPLYEINEDGIKVPLNLTYHATGIKVSEEASWVGLGWDLQIGSIVQIVNGKDDYSSDAGGGGYTKWRPDWADSPTPSEYPYRFNYPYGTDGGTWYTPYPSSTAPSPQPHHSYKIPTDYYVPINTNFNYRALTEFTSPTYESEPDVFKANFLGYSVHFMLDWNSGQIVVLNKKGYKVTRNTDDTWTIIVPSGEEFDFQIKTDVTGLSSDNSSFQYTSSSSLSSRIWMLTKIVTKNKKQIVFNYSTTSSAYKSFPSYTQKVLNAVLNSTTAGVANMHYYGYPSATLSVAPGTSAGSTLSFSQEKYVTLSSIVFPNGQINFTTSSRTDMNGASKLDNVSIVTSTPIKTYTFNYGYFDASGVGGNTYTVNNTDYTAANKNYRLKLLSLSDNRGATYNFTYNATLLPPKNSYGADFWGYFNGQILNPSMAPNGARFNVTTFGDNGNNHSANEFFAQAGILQEITYPTGGKVDFIYELNAFDNFWVPDFSTTSNSISHGNGLRIQGIVYKQADGTQSKKDLYSYSTGKAILPVSTLRNYMLDVSQEAVVGSTTQLSILNYTINELNVNGFFSQNLFGSITGVGYSTVTKQEVDPSGNPNGKVVSTFYNNPDVITPSASTFFQLSASLPALKKYNTPDNGTPITTQYYDQSNNLLKQITNSYTTSNSAIYYGARMFGYVNLIEYIDLPTNPWLHYDQHLIGFYPLYDSETLLSTILEEDHFGTNIVNTTTSNSYNANHLLSSVTKTGSSFNETTQMTYPPDYPSNTTLAAMTAQNRLADVVTVSKSSGPHAYSVYDLTRSYQASGSLYVPSQDVVLTGNVNVRFPTTTTYESYDSSNGNLLQYSKNTLTNSFIYDYNNENVIAEIKNAAITDVAYTSFEADGKGRWTFAGTAATDAASITGKKDYSLSGGNITRNGLNTTKTYIVSYWSKAGVQSVNGSTTAVQGYTCNGWTYFEHKIVNPAAGTVTVSGSAVIDELRLYPADAEMTSYTYEPLVGITSQSDVSAKVTYYEYDSAKRLLDIRDQNKNILKAFCYNYAGQLTNCDINNL